MRFKKGFLSFFCIFYFISFSYIYGENINIKEHIIFDERNKSKDKMLYVIFLGDYELTREKYMAMDETSKEQLSIFLEYLTNRGLTIVNFEMLLPTSDLFAIEFLSKKGIDAAIIANNHSCDHGEKYIQETEEQLIKSGIQTIGSKKNPYFYYTKDGMNCNIFAIANKMDKECNGVIRLHDEGFLNKTIQRLKFKDTPLIVVIHDDGPSQYITDYEESKLKPFLDDGANIALLLGAHIIKGYRLYNYNSKLAIFSIGNFLLHWRGEEEYISIAPIIGFDDKKIIYFAIIPFYDELGKKFRILQNSEYEAAIDLYLKRTNTSSATGYMQEGTRKLVGQSLTNLLKGKGWDKVKPRHLLFFLKYLFYNYFGIVIIIFFVLLFSVFLFLYLKKKKKKKK
jgi:hypothetical protein